MLEKLGDLSGLAHLEPSLREFLRDHPHYDTNVFVMMRFEQHQILAAAYSAVHDVLLKRGMDAVRADSRDYTGELWSNIQTYMHGCKLGIAIFENLGGSNEINPNVSLELGYMVALRKRTLILKPEFTDVALSSLVSRARDQRKISDAPEPQAPCVLPVPLVRIRCARSGWVVKKV